MGTMAETGESVAGRGRLLRRVAAVLLLAAAAAAGRAQGLLDERCVVSVLNRSTRVQADGTWVLPNVPSSQGLVRARATCVQEGASRAGQSDLVSIPPDGVLRVAAIAFGSPQPIPQKLQLLAPQTAFSIVGQTAQLVASAIYADGSQTDVSAPEAGTGYRTSNA